MVSLNSYYGRTVEVFLDNGFTLYFIPPIDNKIMIGDIVKKENDTYEYFIYRKTSKEDYEFWSSNNFNDIR